MSSARRKTPIIPFETKKNRGSSPRNAVCCNKSSRFGVGPIFGIPEIEGILKSESNGAMKHQESRFSFGGFKTPRLTLAEKWRKEYGETEETVETDGGNEESRITDEKCRGEKYASCV